MRGGEGAHRMWGEWAGVAEGGRRVCDRVRRLRGVDSTLRTQGTGSRHGLRSRTRLRTGPTPRLPAPEQLVDARAVGCGGIFATQRMLASARARAQATGARAPVCGARWSARLSQTRLTDSPSRGVRGRVVGCVTGRGSLAQASGEHFARLSFKMNLRFVRKVRERCLLGRDLRFSVWEVQTENFFGLLR